MSEVNFKLIILGSDENAYGNARLFHEAYSKKALLMCSKQLIPTRLSNIFDIKVVPNFNEEKVFVEVLKKVLHDCSKKYEKLLVLPCSDYYVNLLVKNYDNFDNLIANKFIPVSLLDKFYRKDHFYMLCDKYGLDYPKTCIASLNERKSVINKLNFDFPIVVKPDNSNSSDYLNSVFPGKKKVYFFNNKKEYLELIDCMNKSTFKGKLIIQEFIPGGDDTGMVINSYSNNNSKVLFSCMGQPILEEYAPALLGNYAAIITRSNKELYKKIQNFLEGIGYVGFSNIDLKYDKRSNKYLAFELNPRLGRSSFFVRATGYNVIKTFVDNVVNNTNPQICFSNETAL